MHDFYIDEFDTIDGKHYLYNKRYPDKKYEVVGLLDASGNETDDPEIAVGGVVKIAEQCFTTFMF